MTEPAQRKHHQLQAWQVAMRLAREIYGLTSRFPAHEQYGLTSQLRRSAVSVPSNIAEGAARSSTKEFLHFLSIARGSLSEIDTQLMLADDVRFIEDERLPQIMETLDHAFGVQGGLINSLKTRI
jgi:four helix bundle protein